MTTRERLKALFANQFNREQFKLSMGETRIDAAGINTLLGFLAQSIATVAYEDDRYLAQLIGTHMALRKIVDDLLKIPGADDTVHSHHPLLLGVLIENVIEAVAQLKKEDQT